MKASRHRLFTGRAGLLFSPEKSLLLFAPIVILVVVGSIRLWTAEKRFVVVLTLANFLVFFVLSAIWHSWQGGWSWGPRLLLPGVIPTMVLLSLTDQERNGEWASAFSPPDSSYPRRRSLCSTRAQQLDQPLPSVGPSVLRQYQLVPAVTRYTIDALRERLLGGFAPTLCLFGRSTLGEFGTKGLLAGISRIARSCWVRWSW